MPPQNVALAVLAGGEGTRMGYPKADIRLGGRAILHVLLERFAWEGPTLLVTAPGREHPTGCESFGCEAVDPSPGQGPLRGLLTALESSPVPMVVVVAVDMPLVAGEHLRWLAAELARRPEAEGLMIRQREPPQLQPLPSAFRATAAPLVRQALASGRRSLHGLADHASVVVVDAPPSWGDETWTNLNRPEDLEAAGG